MSASSSWTVPASSVRANWRLLPDDRAEDRLASLCEIRVGAAHDLDDHLGQLGQERLASTEQAPVANGAADDPAKDVATALVRWQHSVGDQERDRSRHGRR